MMRGSVGGALTYYTAVAGAPVAAIACLNLFDFGNGQDGLLISRLAPLAKSALMVRLLNRGMWLLKPLGWLRIPFNWLGAFNKLMDDRDQTFQAQWNADPIPPRLVSLRSLASNLDTAPAVPFEASPIPVLVINQKRDQMVDPQTTRQNYERLKAPKKYLEIPFGHWSQQPEFWQTIIEASHHWFQKHSK
jgi:pimeloyl-ACP methyl ester carboxylesterase